MEPPEPLFRDDLIRGHLVPVFFRVMDNRNEKDMHMRLCLRLIPMHTTGHHVIRAHLIRHESDRGLHHLVLLPFVCDLPRARHNQTAQGIDIRPVPIDIHTLHPFLVAIRHILLVRLEHHLIPARSVHGEKVRILRRAIPIDVFILVFFRAGAVSDLRQGNRTGELSDMGHDPHLLNVNDNRRERGRKAVGKTAVASYSSFFATANLRGAMPPRPPLRARLKGRDRSTGHRNRQGQARSAHF